MEAMLALATFRQLEEKCAELNIPIKFDGAYVILCEHTYSSLEQVEIMVEGMDLYARFMTPPEPEEKNLDGNKNPHNPNDHSTKVTTEAI